MRDRPRFAIANFKEWADRLKSNPWQKMLTLKQSLTPEALKRFVGRQAHRS